jgi:hypothetical protein
LVFELVAHSPPALERAAVPAPNDPADPWGLAPPGVDPDSPIPPMRDPNDDGERLEMCL